MIIKALRECPEHKETVIQWMNKEFGTKSSYHFYEGIVNHSLVAHQLPITFVAVEESELLGTVGIWRGDLLSRQDLFPWCSALIVNSKHRNKGIGRVLQDYAVSYCKENGYDTVYLYTDLKGYYDKNGWEKYDQGYEYMGDLMTIYKKYTQ